MSMVKNREEKIKKTTINELPTTLQLGDRTDIKNSDRIDEQNTVDKLIRFTKRSDKKNNPALKSKKTPKKIRQSIKLDTVNPSDYLAYNLTHSCEFCSHWNPDNGLCTLGYKNDVHRLEANLRCYELSGKMAFCRFLEID
jgi:hypothetical protein